jgi:hypothetical protein
MEAVVSVVIAAAATVAAMGNAEHPLDRADGTADTGADRATNHAPHGAGDSVAFIRTFLGAPNDALGMARLWDAGQRGQNGGTSEEQTERQTSRP